MRKGLLITFFVLSGLWLLLSLHGMLDLPKGEEAIYYVTRVIVGPGIGLVGAWFCLSVLIRDKQRANGTATEPVRKPGVGWQEPPHDGV